jgi:hypothetical protein
MKTATLVRALDDWQTDSALYRLDPPIIAAGQVTSHVIVSTVPRVDGVHGSVILPATPTGDVTSWTDAIRSEHDGHEAALSELGYRVVKP